MGAQTGSGETELRKEGVVVMEVMEQRKNECEKLSRGTVKAEFFLRRKWKVTAEFFLRRKNYVFWKEKCGGPGTSSW